MRGVVRNNNAHFSVCVCVCLCVCGWVETDLYPYRGTGSLQVLLSFGHQDGFVAGEHRAVAVCGWVSSSCHHCRCLHGDGHSLSAVQAVGGVVEASAGAQSQAEALGSPHPAVRAPSLVVSVLHGLSAALGCDGDEGFGGGAGGHWGRVLLVSGRVGDSWKCQTDRCEFK